MNKIGFFGDFEYLYWYFLNYNQNEDLLSNKDIFLKQKNIKKKIIFIQSKIKVVSQ